MILSHINKDILRITIAESFVTRPYLGKIENYLSLSVILLTGDN